MMFEENKLENLNSFVVKIIHNIFKQETIFLSNTIHIRF